MQKLEIFKSGRHTAMSGQTLEFTEADLAKTAASYDPAVHEAPIVVGHPSIDAPAYGWIRGLEYTENKLNALPEQVDPQFAELVAAGRFKKMSASFYLPDAANNPKPGVYYLRHVGFLGAQPPAIKGLKSAAFAEEDEGVIEFGDYDDQVNAGLWRRMREWLISKFGLEEADKTLPSNDIAYLDTMANQPEEKETPAQAFAEKQEKEDVMTKEAELAAREDDIKKKEAQFSERETALKKKETETRHAEHCAFADALVKEGRLLPAQKGKAVAILDFAAGVPEAGAMEFSEGDEKKKMPASEAFKELLKAFPKSVAFGEAAPEDGKKATAVLAYDGKVDEDRLELHNKTLAYMESNKGTGYEDALKTIISKEGN